MCVDPDMVGLGTDQHVCGPELVDRERLNVARCGSGHYLAHVFNMCGFNISGSSLTLSVAGCHQATRIFQFDIRPSEALFSV